MPLVHIFIGADTQITDMEDDKVPEHLILQSGL